MAPRDPPLLEYELGLAAHDWIRYALEQGASLGGTLAKALLAREDLGRGRVTTMLPTGLPATALSEFDRGGKLAAQAPPVALAGGGIAVPTPSTAGVLSQIVQDFLLESPRNTFIVQEGLARADDPSSQHGGSTIVAGREVYRFATAASDADAVGRCVRSAHAVYPPGLAVLIRLRESDEPFSDGLQWRRVCSNPPPFAPEP